MLCIVNIPEDKLEQLYLALEKLVPGAQYPLPIPEDVVLEEVNMDDLLDRIGPDRETQAQNIPYDPMTPLWPGTNAEAVRNEVIGQLGDRAADQPR